MIKTILFANALRLRKGIDYPFTKEGFALKPILLPAWIELVNKYTQLDLSSYSIIDMIHRFTSGNLVIDIPEVSGTSVKYNKASVVCASLVSFDRKIKTNRWLPARQENLRFLKGLMRDDVVYDKVTQWFTFFENRITSKRTLLHSGNKVLALSVIPPITNTESKFFRKFVAKKLNLTDRKLTRAEARKVFKAVRSILRDPVKREALKALSLKMDPPANPTTRNETVFFRKFAIESLKIDDYYMILPKPEKGVFMKHCHNYQIMNTDPVYGGARVEDIGGGYVKYHWSIEDSLKINEKDLYGE